MAPGKRTTRSDPNAILESLPPKSRKISDRTTKPNRQARTRAEPVDHDDEEDDEERYKTAAENGVKGKDFRVQIILRKKNALAQPPTSVTDSQGELRRLSAGKSLLGVSMKDPPVGTSQRKISPPKRTVGAMRRGTSRKGSGVSTQATQETIVVASTPLFRSRPGRTNADESSSNEEVKGSESIESPVDEPHGPVYQSKSKPKQKGQKMLQTKTPRKGNARPSGNTSAKSSRTSRFTADMLSPTVISKGTGTRKSRTPQHTPFQPSSDIMDGIIEEGITPDSANEEHGEEEGEEEEGEEVEEVEEVEEWGRGEVRGEVRGKMREQVQNKKKEKGKSSVSRSPVSVEHDPPQLSAQDEEEVVEAENLEQNYQHESDHEKALKKQRSLIDQVQESRSSSSTFEGVEENKNLALCVSLVDRYNEQLEDTEKKLHELMDIFDELKLLQNPGSNSGYVGLLTKITHTIINSQAPRLSLEEEFTLLQLDEMMEKLGKSYKYTQGFESMFRRFQKKNLTQRANVDKCQFGIRKTMKARGYKSDHTRLENEEDRGAHALREKNKIAARKRNEEIARALAKAKKAALGYGTPESVEAYDHGPPKKRRRVTDEEQRWEDERLQKRVRAEQEVEHDDGYFDGYNHRAEEEDGWSGEEEAEHPIVIDEGEVEIVHVEAFGERHAKARAKEERAARMTRDEDEVEVLEDHEWEEPEIDALFKGIEKFQGNHRFHKIKNHFGYGNQAPLDYRTVEAIRDKALEIKKEFIESGRSHVLGPCWDGI